MRGLMGSIVLAALVSGCAGVQFYDADPDTGRIGLRNDYVSFYETKPAAVVAHGADCSVTVTLISMPGKKRYLRLKSGYGSNKLATNFGVGGTLSSLNQETDTKVPETITAVGGAVKNFADAKLIEDLSAGESVQVKECSAHADVYEINDGRLVNPQPFNATAVSRIVAPPPAKSRKEAAVEIVRSCKAAIAGEPTGLPASISAAFIRNCKDQILK